MDIFFYKSVHNILNFNNSFFIISCISHPSLNSLNSKLYQIPDTFQNYRTPRSTSIFVHNSILGSADPQQMLLGHITQPISYSQLTKNIPVEVMGGDPISPLY